MHELSIMTSILEIVLEYAQKFNAKKVKRINLLVGEMSDLIPEWMQRYFDFVSKDTLAEQAKLIIERIPAVIRCKKCGHSFAITRGDFQFLCRKCESDDIELLSGREFKIESIEVE